MGRVEDASQNHQEIHQNPTFDTSEGVPPPPPPPEEDLYEPPADYQPPPPRPRPRPPPTTKDKSTPQPQVVHSFPPSQGNDDDDYEKPPPQAFPPTQSQAFFPPSSSPHPFPPTQSQAFFPPSSSPQPFPPTQSQAFFPPQNNVHIQPNQFDQTPQNHQNFPAQQGIPVGINAPSPFMVQQNQPWKSHLFDCMKNPQNAIITLFFPCVTFGQIAEVLDNGSTSCGTSGIVYSLIACCIAMPCLMSCGYRSKLRAKFGLVESPAPDCLIHCFCEWCALCQEYRELEQRGFDPSIGHAGNMAKQQRQKQFGMASPMQQRMMM